METAPPLASKPAQNNTLHGGARGPVLRTRKEFVDYVQKEKITHVVAYEFSGGIIFSCFFTKIGHMDPYPKDRILKSFKIVLIF